MLRWIRCVREGRDMCLYGLRCCLRRAKDPTDDGSEGHTSRSGDGNGAMGHASPNSLRTCLPNSLHSTKGHSNRNISTDCNSMNSSKDCNMRSSTGCNACSSTMNCRCCMDRNNIRNCFRGPTASRKGFRLPSPPYLRPSGHIESLQRSFPVS